VRRTNILSMKKLIIALFLLPIFASAQTYQSMPQAGYGPVKRMLFDSVLTLPLNILKLQNATGGRDIGQIRYNVSDSSIYIYSGSRWIKSGIDTSTIYYNLGLKLNISDTAQMMTAAPRVNRFLDSIAALKNSLALKLNISDTSSMLMPYTRATQTALKLNISDTAGMLSAYTRLAANSLKLNISDTAAMMAAAPRVQRFLDSVTNLKTSIATKQNTLTLTTTGTSGAATLTGATLNIPNYAGTNIYNSNGSLTSNRTLTLNSQPLTFLGTTRTRFHANGRMIIGDTTDAGYKLDVQGTLRGTENFNFGSTAYTGDAVGMKMELSPTALTGSCFTIYAKTATKTLGLLVRHRPDYGGIVVGDYAAKNITINGEAGIPIIKYNSGSVNIDATTNAASYIGHSGAGLITKNTAARSMAIMSSIADYSDLSSFVASNCIYIGGTAYGAGLNTTTYFFGGGGDTYANNTVARSVTFNSTFPSGLTNGVGGDFRIAGGRGTGTGLPGDVILSTATTTTTGSTLQTVTDRWYVKSSTGTLSNNSAPAATAVVDLQSTTKGFLPPRMTTTQRTAISAPAEGLTVYDLTLHKLFVYDGTAWQAAW